MRRAPSSFSVFVHSVLFVLCVHSLSACGDTDSDSDSDSGVGGEGIVSRTSGVAPLAVQFQAGYIAGADESARFRDFDYTWDFGDAASGTWGTTGRSKNSAKGAIAAHVFESPGTYEVVLTIRDGGGVVGAESYEITVQDPDVFYAGEKTICVSDTAHGDFTGAPLGALQITTDDLSTITEHAQAGNRILFHRGSSWTTEGLTWPENGGPVTLGAYGEGQSPDALGLFSNAPEISVTGAAGVFLPLDGKQDWRVMDLRIVGAQDAQGAVGGAMEMQRHLFLRLSLSGFDCAMGWSHWNTAALMPIDDMVIASCDISESETNVMYVGAERLAVLGNRVRNARTSHVVRIWQAYRSVVSENVVSGSSLDNTNGRHALKLHGPKESELAPADGNGSLAHRSEFSIVSGNVFGSSGPWPLNLAPQDSGSDERLSDIVFERNRYHQDLGDQSATPLQVALRVAARNATIRNNVIDGTGDGNDFTGIWVGLNGAEPAASGVAVYNNTIFRANNDVGNGRVGIAVGAEATSTVVRNNLISFPGATVPTAMIDDASADLVEDHNLMTETAGFVGATALDPLARDFGLDASSPALDSGAIVPVFEDLEGNPRDDGLIDLGARERI